MRTVEISWCRVFSTKPTGERRRQATDVRTVC